MALSLKAFNLYSKSLIQIFISYGNNAHGNAPEKINTVHAVPFRVQAILEVFTH